MKKFRVSDDIVHVEKLRRGSRRQDTWRKYAGAMTVALVLLGCLACVIALVAVR